MATRNHEDYVRDAVESVLTQSYDPVEVVAVDDASTDATADVVESLAHEHPDVLRLVRHRSQHGIAATRAEALALARGSLIGLLDSDDLWLPGKLEAQVPVLEQRRDVGLVYSNVEAFDSETGATLEWGSPLDGEPPDMLLELFERGCFFATGTVLMRRAAIEQRRLNFWNPGYPSYDDYLLFLALALDWRFALVPRTVARYRRHAGNLTNSLFAGNVAYARFKLLELFLHRFPDARQRLGPTRRRGLSTHLVNAAAFERVRGTRARGARMFGQAFVIHPPTALAALGRAGREFVTHDGARAAGG
jgi:glycosyltransferase involved in cell wall biosynthesis